MQHKFYLLAIAIGVLSVFSFKTAENKEKVYNVNVQKTKSTWLGTKVTGQHEGTINIVKGSVNYDGTAITGGIIEFDMNSIVCTDLADEEWNAKLVGHLKSDDFFGVAKHQFSTFKIKKVEHKSGNKYEVTGDLIIKGIMHETNFPATIKISDDVIIAVATIPVNRTLYGIKYGSANFFDDLGDKAIGDIFELKVQVVAQAQ